MEYSLRGLMRGKSRTLLAFLAAVVAGALAATASAFLRGMELSLGSTASPDRIIVMGAGSEESIERSEIGAGVPGVLSASIQGIRKTGSIEHVSPETHVAVPMTIGTTPGAPENALVRGVTPTALLVHPEVQLTTGRWPDRGANEIAAGMSALRRIGLDASTAVGSTVSIDGHAFTIVGLLKAPRSTIDGEWWMPIEDFTTLLKRETISACVVDLDGAELGDAKAFALMRLDLELAVVAEQEYYAALLAFFAPIRLLVVVVASLMAAAAALGGASALAAAFSERVRENAVLETLGFPRRAVVADIALQCAIIAVSGALAGGLLARFSLSHVLVEFSMGTFALQFDTRALTLAALTGVLVTIVATVASSWRWLSMQTPEALRTT